MLTLICKTLKLLDMIPIVDVWRSVQGTAKKSTTGYQTPTKFNDDVELVQLSILKALCELYEKEQVISDDLSQFIVTQNSIPTARPAQYSRFVTAEINGKEVYPLHRNAVSMTKTSPVRGKVNGYYFEGNYPLFHIGDGPVTTASFTYIRRPNVASIGMNYSAEGGDYQTPYAVANLEWRPEVRNLIEAMLLERLGVETREVIAMEFARLGIQRETSNYQ